MDYTDPRMVAFAAAVERSTRIGQGDRMRAVVEAARASLPCQCAACLATAHAAIAGAYLSAVPDEQRLQMADALTLMMQSYAGAKEGVRLEPHFPPCSLPPPADIREVTSALRARSFPDIDPQDKSFRPSVDHAKTL
jgi:hypothetical protein